jgi:hypothetical protein
MKKASQSIVFLHITKNCAVLSSLLLSMLLYHDIIPPTACKAPVPADEKNTKIPQKQRKKPVLAAHGKYRF